MAIVNLKEPYTGIPTAEAQGGMNQARATPEAYGAGVAAAGEKLGEAGSEAAFHIQGMINETQANNAEADFIKQSGDLKAKYMQYEGLQADAARPQYESELQALRNQYRAGLAPNAQRMFDSTTTHQLALQTSEYSQYAASQIKSANLQSHEAVGNTAVASAGNLGVVLDPEQTKWQLDTIRHTGNAIADLHGDSQAATGIDDGKGNYSYPDTPEGQAAKARHMQYTNTKLAAWYETAVKTVADNMGAAKAADWAQQHLDEMPDVAKVKLNQYLAPKIKNETITGIVNNTMQQADHDYTQNIIIRGGAQNPLDVIRRNEGIGYSKDNKGEVVNGINSLAFPQQFAEAKQILQTQGQAAATKYADDFYQKNIIEKNHIESLPPETQAIVADGLVNHGASDFGQSLIKAAKNGASPQQLIDMRKAEYDRLNATGKPEYTSAYQGWMSRLDGLRPTIQPNVAMQQSRADYLKANEEDLTSRAYEQHLRQYPDDVYGANSTSNRMRTQINHVISMENKHLSDDVDTVSKVIEGGFNGGRKPTSLQEISMASPDAKSALERLEEGRPKIVDSIEKQLAANVNGEKAKGYGDGFLSIMNRIASDDETDSIKNSKDLAETYAERQDIFVNGYAKAGKLLQQAATPEGKAKIAAQAQFLTGLRQKMVAGESDEQGKSAFNKAQANFFAQYETAEKEGKQNTILDWSDKNPFLAGLNIPHPAELTARKIQNSLTLIDRLATKLAESRNNAE